MLKRLVYTYTMKKIYLLTLLLIAYRLPAQTIFDDTKIKQHTFRYSPSNPAPLNNILKKLAEGNNRPLLGMEYSIEYRQRLSIMRTGQKIKVIAMNDMFSTIGPVYYRGMDVSDLLIPSSMDMTLIRINSSGGRPIPIEHRFNNVPIRNKTADRREEDADDAENTPWSVSAQEITFQFSADAQKAFFDFSNKVNDYYLDAAMLQHDMKLAATINPHDFENFEMQNARLETLEKNLTLLESRNYASYFNLYLNDPAAFLAQAEVQKENLLRLRSEMNQTYGMLPQLYYDKAIWFMSSGNKHLAKLYLGRSLTFNPLFAPAAMQIALLEFRSHNLCDADMHIRQVLLNMMPDPVTYDYAASLAKDLYQAYLETAGQQLKSGKFSEANDNLLRAESLCNDLREVKCSADLYELLRVARNGLYKNLLDAAASHYKNNELEKAERKLKEAKRLREKYNTDITDSETERTIGAAIIQKRYDDIIATSKSLLNNNKFSDALEQLEYAGYMQAEFPSIKPSAEAGDLIKKAATPIAKSMIDEGLNLASANQLEQARKKVREADEWIARYALNEAELSSKMTELKSRIFSQECKNAQEKFDGLYRKGNQAATELDFISAHKFYSLARQTASDNNNCGLNTYRLEDEIANIGDGYSYQSMIASVLTMHEQEQYAASLERYREAGEFFEMKNVKRYGLRHLTLDEFTETRCRNNFVKFMGDKALLDTEFDKSLRLFKLILSRGYDVNFMKDSLNRLGRALAIRDKAANPKGHAKKLVEQYTAGDKKLKELRSGYLKGWKAAK